MRGNVQKETGSSAPGFHQGVHQRGISGSQENCRVDGQLSEKN